MHLAQPGDSESVQDRFIGHAETEQLRARDSPVKSPPTEVRPRVAGGRRGRLREMGTAQIPDPTESGVRHQLRPLFDQIVIKELDQDRVRRSGLVVPPGTHDPPPEQGIVLAVGPGLDWWAQAGVEMPVAPGDHVVFPASAGVWVEIDEERLLVCRVTQLLGVLESASIQR
jgi:chaperonin GroES